MKLSALEMSVNYTCFTVMFKKLFLVIVGNFKTDNLKRACKVYKCCMTMILHSLHKLPFYIDINEICLQIFNASQTLCPVSSLERTSSLMENVLELMIIGPDSRFRTLQKTRNPLMVLVIIS